MHPIYCGAAEHHLKDGSVRRFNPSGPMYLVPGKDNAPARRRRRGAEDVTPYGVGLTARLFVGLNVGKMPTYKIEQVVEATKGYRRERQHALPDSSFIAQKGVYTIQATGDVIDEDSVQIIIIDLVGMSLSAFTSQIIELASYLREKFHQESVIVEIQKAGVSQEVYGVTKETKK